MLTRTLLSITAINLLLAILFAFSTPASADVEAPGVSSPAIGAPALTPATESRDTLDGALVSPSEGWLLIRQHLYSTHDGGTTWNPITPPNLGAFQIRGVSFPDLMHGRVLLADTAMPPVLAFAATEDGGKTWRTSSLSLFSRDDPSSLVSSTSMYWLDSQIGWLVFHRMSTANFDDGTLFKTSDGGKTWKQLSTPLGDPVYFVTPELGWTAGGPTGEELYSTANGGTTWQRQSINSSGRVRYQLPRFDNPLNGILPVVAGSGASTELEMYSTRDGGRSWDLASRTPLEQSVSPGTHLPIALLEDGSWIAIAPRTRHLIRAIAHSPVTVARNPDPLLGAIRKLNMADASTGWAFYADGSCKTTKAECFQTNRLLRTVDGGVTWQVSSLPEADGPASTSGARSAATPSTSSSNTETITGQGFDACYAAELDELQAWWTSSPYKTVNLYLGGASLYHGCDRITGDYVAQASQQGWKFIPTWVGPQAPSSCTARTYPQQMDLDPGTAYGQGVYEASAAVNKAANLGLTDALGTGAVIYYDVEAYSMTIPACTDAVNSFILGWTAQLQLSGNIAAGYGGAYSSAVSRWWTNSPQLDGLWLAHWITTTYDQNATVWDPYVPDDYWPDHQRIKQYTGGHNETWGGVTLNIDSDVIDGYVANMVWPFITSLQTLDGSNHPKTAYNPDESIQYSATISNTDAISVTTTLNLSVSGECGPITSLAKSYTAPPGSSAWVYSTTVPTHVCNGTYVYRLQATSDDVITTTFWINGTTYHSFLPLITENP